jgi:hypothetical protein
MTLDHCDTGRRMKVRSAVAAASRWSIGEAGSVIRGRLLAGEDGPLACAPAHEYSAALRAVRNSQPFGLSIGPARRRQLATSLQRDVRCVRSVRVVRSC